MQLFKKLCGLMLFALSANGFVAPAFAAAQTRVAKAAPKKQEKKKAVGVVQRVKSLGANAGSKLASALRAGNGAVAKIVSGVVVGVAAVGGAYALNKKRAAGLTPKAFPHDAKGKNGPNGTQSSTQNPVDAKNKVSSEQSGMEEQVLGAAKALSLAEEKIARLEDQIKKEQAQAKSVKDESQRAQNRALRNARQARGKVQRMGRKQFALKAELASTKQGLDAVTEENAVLQAGHDALCDKATDITAEMARDLEALQNMASQDDLVMARNGLGAARQDRLSELERELEEARQEKADLQERLADKDELIRCHEANKDWADSRLDQIPALRQQQQDAERARLRGKKELANLRKAMYAMQVRIMQESALVEEDNKEQHARIARLQQALDVARAREQELEQRLACLEFAHKNVQDMEQLVEQYEAMARELVECEGANEEAAQLIERMTQQMEVKQAIVEQKEALLQETLRRQQELNQLLGVAKALVEDEGKARKAEKQLRKKTEAQLAETEKVAQELDQELREAQEKREFIAARLRELDAHMERALTSDRCDEAARKITQRHQRQVHDRTAQDVNDAHSEMDRELQSSEAFVHAYTADMNAKNARMARESREARKREEKRDGPKVKVASHIDEAGWNALLCPNQSQQLPSGIPVRVERSAKKQVTFEDQYPVPGPKQHWDRMIRGAKEAKSKIPIKQQKVACDQYKQWALDSDEAYELHNNVKAPSITPVLAQDWQLTKGRPLTPKLARLLEAPRGIKKGDNAQRVSKKQDSALAAHIKRMKEGREARQALLAGAGRK